MKFGSMSRTLSNMSLSKAPRQNMASNSFTRAGVWRRSRSVRM